LQRSVDNGRRAIGLRYYELYDQVVPDDPQPTRLGNIRSVTEKYSEVAYGVHFRYLWPRLQLVLLKDEKFAAVVDLASSKLDFAVLMLTLTLLFNLFWIPVLAALGDDPFLFLTLGVLGPFAVRFFYLLLEESQKSFAEVVQAAIDGFRVELLAALHLPRPRSLFAERELWSVLAQMHNPATATDYPLRHGQK
jgi:hypothetical protein